MKKSSENHATILTFFQDQSITNILKFILQDQNIQLLNYNASQTVRDEKVKAIILDNDIKHNEKDIFLHFVSQYFPKAPILLTIGCEYNKELLNVYNHNIVGVIYKPFDVEEIVSIVKEDLI